MFRVILQSFFECNFFYCFKTFFLSSYLYVIGVDIFILFFIMDEDIEIVFHHGGKFIIDGTLKYEGKTITLFFNSDR